MQEMEDKIVKLEKRIETLSTENLALREQLKDLNKLNMNKENIHSKLNISICYQRFVKDV